ncbi:MAG: Lysine exporter protein [Myxococcales bacterium]|nr:Lysine exporter protein [Myxococcales bacterium]
MTGPLQLVAAAGLGLGLGIVTGMPLGVVNIAIVDAATAGNKRFAVSLGIGGALADSVHAALAFAGVGHIITQHPEWTRIMAVVAAAMIVGYAVLAWHNRHRKREPGGNGLVTGLVLTLPNPGALAAWVAVAASIWPDISIANALVLGAGVGFGSAAWFYLLATSVAKVRRDHPALRIVPRAALVVLVAIAATGLVRAYYGV